MLSLGWRPILPDGWSMLTNAGAVWGSGAPDAGITNGPNEIVFTGDLTDNPIVFYYTIRVPANATGSVDLSAQVDYWLDDMSDPLPIAAQPGILTLPELHTLEIVSDHGLGAPLAGIYTNAYGTLLTNVVAGLEAQGGTQYVTHGWAMTGNDPISGSTTNCTMSHTNDAVLTWLWATNCLLTVSVGTGGSLGGDTNGWYAAGTVVSLTAVAAPPWYHFTSWAGDTNGCTLAGNTFTGAMTQARTVTASFAINGSAVFFW